MENKTELEIVPGAWGSCRGWGTGGGDRCSLAGGVGGTDRVRRPKTGVSTVDAVLIGESGLAMMWVGGVDRVGLSCEGRLGGARRVGVIGEYGMMWLDSSNAWLALAPAFAPTFRLNRRARPPGLVSVDVVTTSFLHSLTSRATRSSNSMSLLP